VVASANPGSGNVALGFRLGAKPTGASIAPSVGYYFEVNLTASAYNYSLLLVDSTGGAGTLLTSGAVTETTTTPFVLGATFKGSAITLYINGNQIAQASNSAFTSGSMGLCSDDNATFKDAQIYAFS
jgi:hypothetical protein